MRWISSTGGPLILMDQRFTNDWHGIDVPETNSSTNMSQTDYERACGVDDYIGQISVGNGSAVVLGDEPMQATWMAGNTSGGTIARWRYARDQQSAERAVGHVPDSVFEATDVSFNTQGDLILFDSAINGQSLRPEEALLIRIPGGTYVIETADYSLDEDTALVLHRLKPV